MRLTARILLFGAFLLLALLICIGARYARRSYERARELSGVNDAAFRLLLATPDDAQALAGLGNAGNDADGRSAGTVVGVSIAGGGALVGGVRTRQHVDLSLNVAVVMVVALLSVALLITVVIVIAVAIDSSSSSSGRGDSHDLERKLCEAAADEDDYVDEYGSTSGESRFASSAGSCDLARRYFPRHSWFEMDDEEQKIERR